jgi:hypothetical protein
MQTEDKAANTEGGHVCSTGELGPLPDCAATIGTDGHPRHIKHWWGIVEAKLYGPPHGLYTADQMRAYAAAAVLREREECAKVCDEVASQSASHWPYKLANKIRERNKP